MKLGGSSSRQKKGSPFKKKRVKSYRISPEIRNRLEILVENSPLENRKNLDMIKEEIKEFKNHIEIISRKSKSKITEFNEKFQQGSVNLKIAKERKKEKRLTKSPKKINNKNKLKYHKRNKSTTVDSYDKSNTYFMRNSHKRSSSKDSVYYKYFSKPSEELNVTKIKQLISIDNPDSTRKNFVFKF